jgi:hypothetical protein
MFSVSSPNITVFYVRLGRSIGSYSCLGQDGSLFPRLHASCPSGPIGAIGIGVIPNRSHLLDGIGSVSLRLVYEELDPLGRRVVGNHDSKETRSTFGCNSAQVVPNA